MAKITWKSIDQKNKELAQQELTELNTQVPDCFDELISILEIDTSKFSANLRSLLNKKKGLKNKIK